MRKNKDISSLNRLKLIIATTLLLTFQAGFSQKNQYNVSSFTLDVEGGINAPTSDFKDYANSGFQVGLMLNRVIYKNLGIGVSANYNQFGLKNNIESANNSWSNFSFGIGPQYTLPINMFFIQLHGHLGASLIKTPEIIHYAQNIHESYNKKDFNTFILESKKNTGFHTDLGIKLGVQLSRKIRIFIGSTYKTNLNSPIKYRSRDISEAIHSSGEVNMDLVNRIPFEDNSFALSSFNMNAGISINLGNTSAVRPAQDYNSSRSNKPSPIKWIDDSSGNDSVPRPAQDYNSSRSNKPKPISALDDKIENDTVPTPLLAQDYNSSRSNKPSPIKWIDDSSGNDSVPRPAQDYNSSRSNKPKPISALDDKIENDTVTRPLLAQDYNSSRSNKPSPIKWIDDSSGNDSVPRPTQDYNSNRSNKPKPISALDDKIENDTVPTPLLAQDYNSSRSNKPSPIKWIDDSSGNDSVPRPAQDYNSNRSNKPRPISALDDKIENDTITTPLYAQDYNSSRSNKPSPIKWIDDSSGNDSVPRPTQDYNSNRSNKPRPIRIIDDIGNLNYDEDEVVIVGKLIKITIDSRSFEFIDNYKRKITGKFQPQISDKEIKELKRNFQNKRAMIYIKINKIKLDSGIRDFSYVLLKIQKNNKHKIFNF